MAQSPAAAQRVRLDASAESKCLLEATSRTPAVLDALGIPYKLAQPMFGLIKPVFAHLADIGAAALKMLLGTVTYLGQGDRRQVDVTHWRLPDRTPQPTAPTADGLANEVTTVIRDTIAGVLAVHQRAAAATTAGGEAWQAAHAALSKLEEQQRQAREREEAMRAQLRELEEQRAAERCSRAALEQQLESACAVAIAAKALAEVATQEQQQQQSVGTAAAKIVADAVTGELGAAKVAAERVAGAAAGSTVNRVPAWPTLKSSGEALRGEPGHPIPIHYASDASSVRVASSDVPISGPDTKFVSKCCPNFLYLPLAGSRCPSITTSA